MSKTVLIVDDVELVRFSLHAALQAAGHEVKLAESAREALEIVKQGALNLVVTDIWMPDQNGIQLIQQIRQTNPGLRIFAITGGGPRLSLEAATSLAQVWGAEKVFIKPFDEADLVKALEAEA